jgi:transmembrane sensor
MTNITGYHRYLFLGKVTNTLTEKERQELDALLMQNEEAQQEFSALIQTLPQEDVADHYNRLNTPGFWQNLPAGAITKRKANTHALWIKRLSIAAVSIGVLFIGWQFFSEKFRTNEITASDKHKPAVILRLADGKQIDLSEQKGQINEKNIIIKNEEKTLSYQNTSDAANGVNSVEVPVGMDYKINLSDGSEVWLNSKTVLQFPTKFSGANREITISGEAYLNITKDASKPFLVNLPNGIVEVTGTLFNVNSYEANVSKVALVQGGINLKTSDSVIRIQPGEQGIYDKKTEAVIRQSFDAKFVLSWTKGLYYFDKASLANILPVLDRWYGVKTKIDNNDLLKKRFVLVLNKHQPLPIFLENLKIISKIESYFDDEDVLHFK